MKKVMYEDILDIDKIIYEYKKIVLNTKHRDKVYIFNLFYMSNIIEIYNSLKNRIYSHGKYNIFLIKEKKPRIIMSEKLKDKVVNHLVSDYFLLPNIDKRLVEFNVATRKNKGSKMAIYYMKKYLLKMYQKSHDFYVLKCDISKYFYNIDHDILLSKLKKIIKDDEILKIIENIIYSTNKSYVNEEIRKIQKETSLDLPIYKYKKGLPIGNETSQILAIYYLNDLDHFIKEKLHIKYYIRYMDDFILIHKSISYLKYCYKEIERFLKDIGLSINKKSNIYNIKNGISFLGYKYIFKNDRLLLLVLSNTKKRIVRRIRKKETNILNYKGYLVFGSTNNFMYKYNKVIK